MRHTETTGAGEVRLENSFWHEKQELVRREVIPYQQRALEDGIDGAEPSRCIENFRPAAAALEMRRAG